MADRTIEIRIIGKNEASGALNDVSGAIQNVGKMAAGVAVGGVVAFGGGLVAAATSGLQMNDAMEKATARINAFTKDGGKTAEILEMIRDRAAKTPFAFQEMTNATAALLPTAKQAGVGLDELLEKAEILAASNPAEGLEGAAFALKEAVSGDFTSIIERFNLPRSYINQLKEEGVPALEAVQMAMQEMGLDTDLVAALAETAGGRWSTFQDTLQGLAATVTQPIFDAFSSGLGDVNGMLGDVGPALQEMAEGLAGDLKNAIAWLKDVGWPGVVKALDSLRQAWTNLLPYVMPVFDAIRDAMPMIQQFITDHLDELQGALIAIGGVLGGAVIVSAIMAIGTVIAALASPVALIVAGAALLGAAWDGNWFGIRDTLTEVWAAVYPVLLEIWDWLAVNVPIAIQTLTDYFNNVLYPVFLQVFTKIQEIVSVVLSTITAWWSEHGDSVMTIVSSFISFVWSIITNTLAAIQEFWATWGDTIMEVARIAWDYIKSFIATAMAIIGGIIDAVSAIIKGDWGAFGKALQDIWTAVWDFVQVALNTARDLLFIAIDILIAYIGEQWEAFKTKLSSTWAALWDYVVDWFNAKKALIETSITVWIAAIQFKWAEFKTNLSNAWTALWDGIVNWFSTKRTQIETGITGLITTVQNAWQSFRDNLSNWWSAAWDGIVNKINEKKAEITSSITRLISDIKNMFTADAFKQMGERIIEGIRRGIQEGWDVVTSLAAQLGQALIDAVKASLGLGTASADMAGDLLNAQSNAVLAAGTVSASSAQVNNSVTNNYYFTQTINGSVPSAREEFELMKSNALAFG